MMIKIPAEMAAGLAATEARAQERAAAEQALAAARFASDAERPVSPRSHYVTLSAAADVTDEVKDAAREVFDLWFDNDEPIGWDAFWDRLEAMFKFTINDTDSPAARHIRRSIHHHKKESQE